MTLQDDARMKALNAVERLANTKMELSLIEWSEISNAILDAINQPAPVGGDDRLNRAYTERSIASVLLAKSAIALGFKAGVGTDDNVDWEDQWRVVLYVDLPHGQISWHISPEDQHLLDGLPKYEGKWDGTFNSRSAEFALLSPPAIPDEIMERINETLSYFEDEFKDRPDVWDRSVSAHAGGITPNDLLCIKSRLSGEVPADVRRLREAVRDIVAELAWWVSEHGCCKGHEDDVLKKHADAIAE